MPSTRHCLRHGTGDTALTPPLWHVDLNRSIKKFTGGLHLWIISVHAVLLLTAHVAVERLSHELGVVVSFLR